MTSEVVVQRFSIIHAGKLHNNQPTSWENKVVLNILSGESTTVPRSYKREANRRWQLEFCVSFRLSHRQRPSPSKKSVYTHRRDLNRYQNNTTMIRKMLPGDREARGCWWGSKQVQDMQTALVVQPSMVIQQPFVIRISKWVNVLHTVPWLT